MDDKRFATLLYVADGPRMIREIACLEDAIDFLQTLRDPVNGTVHDTALKACYRAAIGLLAIEHARRLRKFREDVAPTRGCAPAALDDPTKSWRRRRHYRIVPHYLQAKDRPSPQPLGCAS